MFLCWVFLFGKAMQFLPMPVTPSLVPFWGGLEAAEQREGEKSTKSLGHAKNCCKAEGNHA